MSSDSSEHEIRHFKIPPGTKVDKFRFCIEGAYMAWIGSKYSETGPTVAEIVSWSGLSGSEVAKIVATSEFAEAIAKRGVPWAGVGEENPMTRGLSPDQILALGIIVNPTDKRPLASKLKSADVTYGKYRAWLKQPKFKEAISAMGEQMLGDHVTDVHTALTNKATGGDINAIKLYYEISGRFDPAQRQVSELKGMVNLLIEVITTHVKDPELLKAISADMTSKIGDVVKGEIL